MPDRALVGEMPSPSASTSVQFVDDGRGLLTGEVGGIARLWPLQLPVLPALRDTIWSLHVDADHTTLLAACATAFLQAASAAAPAPNTNLLQAARGAIPQPTAEQKVKG